MTAYEWLGYSYAFVLGESCASLGCVFVPTLVKPTPPPKAL